MNLTMRKLCLVLRSCKMSYFVLVVFILMYQGVFSPQNLPVPKTHEKEKRRQADSISLFSHPPTDTPVKGRTKKKDEDRRKDIRDRVEI